MSSHREAPEISKDPVADSTDVYAFVSPDSPHTVTIIVNYVPLQLPAGGPNFYEFGDDVLYEVHINNGASTIGSPTPSDQHGFPTSGVPSDQHGFPTSGGGTRSAESDITYQFRFHTTYADPNSFLYNTGQITSLTSPTWNRRQLYSVTRVDRTGTKRLAQNVPCPPCNVGPRSIPHYTPLQNAAITSLRTGEKVFAGQRAEGFYVDLGSIFDLGDLRPFSNDHLIKMPGTTAGVNATSALNVHSIALQIPISMLSADGSTPTVETDSKAVIGVWTSASRQATRVIDPNTGVTHGAGPFLQVSRLGNPLFNEVLIPITKKDLWNSLPPSSDAEFLTYVQHPELASLLPVLYPGVFPHLAALKAARADLVAILLTGLPTGIVGGFQNYTGPTYADMLRLNMAIPPTTSNPSIYGILGGDLAGFPNGRRVFDDVVTIELRAIAGVTYPLVAPTYVPDGAAGAIYDIVDPSTTPESALSGIGERYLPSFPYLGIPWDGYDNPPATPVPVLGNA